ncbi:MAG: hypothetical protein RIR26_902 [Pseudomonadota bacterium]|jgi:hypothetical protein
MRNHFAFGIAFFSTFLFIPVLASGNAQTPAASAPAASGTAATNVPTAAPATQEKTVDGKIHKVVAKKKEIYVMPLSGGKKMEFYFPENAQFLKGGVPVGFDALKEGAKVRVTYTQKGKRLNPSKAEILE